MPLPDKARKADRGTGWVAAGRFWVFFSKPVFGANVMVSVAKGVEAGRRDSPEERLGFCVLTVAGSN